jgi:hypothetical protein
VSDSPRRRKLDLNTAPAEALAQVPGLDAELALRIIALRPFKHTKELLRVPGLEFAAFEQATAYVKVARAASGARPRPRRKPEPAASAPFVAPVQVHVHVNAAAPAETTTYRAFPAPPPSRPDEIVDPIIIAEPTPRADFRGERGLAPQTSRALTPLGRQVSAALFESYAGPRVVFALFSFTFLAVALALASGRLRWQAAAPPPPVPATATSAPPPTGPQLATQIVQAVSATLAALPSPTSPPTPWPTASAPAAIPTTAFVSNSGLEGVGPQIFNETFIPAGYWSVGETDFSRIAVEEGWLRVLIKTPGSIAWAFNGYSTDDFYYQGLLQMGACQLGDYAGLVFRARDDDNLSLFGLSCDGRYRLVRRVNGEFQFPVDFTFTPEAATGSEAVNLLAVRAEGRKLSLYINDRLVQVVTDAEPGQGFFGAFAKAGATTNLKASFDDLSAWELAP